MSVAQVSDVEARLGRTLSAAETTQATLWLEDVERAILRRISDAVTHAATDTNYHDTLVQVESDAVTRKLENPEGYVSESSEGYSYSFNVGAGRNRVVINPLDLTPEEWTALGWYGGAWVLPPNLQPQPYNDTDCMIEPPTSWYGGSW